MNLIQHYETLLRWIRSCEETPQCELCADAIGVFIVGRFPESQERNDLVSVLYDALEQKKAEIIQGAIWAKKTEEKVIYELKQDS